MQTDNSFGLENDVEAAARKLIKGGIDELDSDFRDELREMWRNATPHEKYNGPLSWPLEKLVHREVRRRISVVADVARKVAADNKNLRGNRVAIFRYLAPKHDDIQGPIYNVFQQHAVPIGPGITWEVENGYRNAIEQNEAALVLEDRSAADEPGESMSNESETPKGSAVSTPGRLPPNFSTIAPERKRRDHLLFLWHEAELATQARANLAALVMLGSLLEGCLLAKCLMHTREVEMARSARKNNQGELLSWERWSLTDFIAVAQDCKWFHSTRIEFAKALRDYRDLIHPFRAAKVGYTIDRRMVSISWEVVVAALEDLGVPTDDDK